VQSSSGGGGTRNNLTEGKVCASMEYFKGSLGYFELKLHTLENKGALFLAPLALE